MKKAPTLKDAQDIANLQIDVAELKKGYTKLNDWLGGTTDPWTGKPRHDGFIETFPIYQEEVKNTLGEIVSKLDNLNGNGVH